MTSMHRQTPGRMRTGRAGFTLVECALALVVVAIGVVAAFALITTGLDSSAKAVSETRAAVFADDIFNGLRSKSVLAFDEGYPSAWEDYWDDFIAGSESVTVAAGELWQFEVTFVWPIGITTNTLQVENNPFTGPDSAEVVAFTNFSVRLGELTDVVNNVLRYNLDVSFSTVTNPVSGAIWTNKVLATLNVWEGEFGQSMLDKALTFTTEIPNSGGL